MTRWASRLCSEDKVPRDHARLLGEVLHKMFPDWVISLRKAISWPLCSLDLTLCDPFGGVSQSSDVQTLSSDRRPTKEADQKETKVILQEMLTRVMENFREWLQMGIGRQGQHSLKLM